MTLRKILITGANGMLGQDLLPFLTAKGYQATAATSKTLNLLRPVAELHPVIARHEPEVILHAAAYTDVDAAEKNPELAMALNKDGTRKLATIARDLGCIFVYLSTDYVFDGEKGCPYTLEDTPNPINTYGLSKYYGELMVKELLDTYYILRTSWLYGIHGRNFVQFVLEAARQGRETRIVSDWVGSPTWTGSFCHLMEPLITSGAYGTYHLADAGAVSKYGQAVAICKAAGLSADHILPAHSREFSFAARRPPFSALDCGDLAVPSWTTSLQAYLAQYLAPSPKIPAEMPTKVVK